MSEGLWDRPLVDLLNYRASRGAPEAFAAALRRLPRGLTHAESITLVAARPPDYSPLSAESAWSASGRGLAVVTSSPSRVLEDLAVFAHWARSLREAGPAQAPVQLAAQLEVGLDALFELEQAAGPEGLGAVAQSGFAPVVRVAAELRPSVRRQRGERLGETLCGDWSGAAPLLVAQDSLAFDVLSPFPRDVGHALYAWGIENAERLRVEGLAEALRRSERSPQDALCSATASELFEVVADPELLEERRRAERSQGLRLMDRDGAVFGSAQLEALEAPDPRLSELQGTVRMLAHSDPQVLIGALAPLIEAKAFSALAACGALSTRTGKPLVSDALVTSEEGYALPSASLLEARATALAIPFHRSDVVELSDPEGSAAWLPKSLGWLRRAMVRGDLRSDLRVTVVFADSDPALSSHPLESKRTMLDAACLNLHVTFSESATISPEDRELRVNQDKDRPPRRRFRV